MDDPFYALYYWIRLLIYPFANLLTILACIYAIIQNKYRIAFCILAVASIFSLVENGLATLLRISDANKWPLSYMPYRPFVWYSDAFLEFTSLLLGAFGMIYLVVSIKNNKP